MLFVIDRWRSSRTSWTTRCVTNARDPDVGASSLPSSAPTSPVCSITVSSAGPRSTRGPAGSSTSPWSRKGLTDPEPCPSAGVETTTKSTSSFFKEIKLVDVFSPDLIYYLFIY